MTYDNFLDATIVAAAREAAPGASFQPYHDQRLLAAGPRPDMLDTSAGLGKTAPVAGVWLFRRLLADPSTPRSLACPPMRVFVEQVYWPVVS